MGSDDSPVDDVADESGSGNAGGSGSPLLEVEALEVHYPIREGLLRREVGRVRAVDGVSFRIGHGETLGLVGESGCGKTSTALAILRLEEPTDGEIRFDGDRVTELSGAALRAFRRRTQLVVQDPNEAFNPRMRVGEAVAEPLVLHGMDDGDRRRRLVESMLERVGLSAADADQYPHEFSDGEKQRIAIARALVPDPDLIVADEPTSALDERVKADVLALLDDVRREFDVSILFVSHDLDVVRRFCDRIAVMYLGELVEQGATGDVFAAPEHPYTRVLRGSVPSLDPADASFVAPLTDDVPDPADPPGGCRFHTRCPEVIQPDDLDLPRDLWLALAELRFTLQTGAIPEAIRIEGDARSDGEERSGGPAGAVDQAAVREALGLQETIPHPTVDRAVEDAIRALADGDIDGASAVLEAAFPTVCERQSPIDARTSDRTVRCHRYDPAIEADPLPWRGDGN